jgi:XRE family transcriptional regulator, fatty acid utilization regulator
MQIKPQDSETARLIFGLKVRQLRLDRGLSSLEVARQSGLSPSYFNEIEKGKKFPKVDKLFDLARALGTDYATLVSPQLSKPLEPLGELINSKVLTELPLDWLGLDVSDLLALLADAPAKVGAFISTLFEISRSYGMRVEGFFFSVLRTYQEMHDSYFPELETAADELRHSLDLPENAPLDPDQLAHTLSHHFQYQVSDYTASAYPAFGLLRSVYFSSGQRLLLNAALTPPQRAFTLARELGYLALGISDRPLLSSVPEAETFDQVLNNFRASYVAGALLMPQQAMLDAVGPLLAQEQFRPDAWLAVQRQFQATSEMFLQRLLGLLAHHYGLNDSFLMRVDHRRAGPGLPPTYAISKEMHLARQHAPHTTIGEHYCRRWVSVSVLADLDAQQRSGDWNGQPLMQAQLSDYVDSPEQYLVLALAQPSPPRGGVISSVSLGLALTDRLRHVVRFANDPALLRRTVNQTCERCPLTDCHERAVPAAMHQRDTRIQEIKQFYDVLKG